MRRIPIRLTNGYLRTKIPLVIGEEYWFNLAKTTTVD
jgi:hypothetical protein